MRISCRVLKHLFRSGYWLLLEMENQMNRDSDAERYHLMEYLRIYHLSKWNPQNSLIHRQMCVKATKVLW
jgi:hypothetical protein